MPALCGTPIHHWRLCLAPLGARESPRKSRQPLQRSTAALPARPRTTRRQPRCAALILPPRAASSPRHQQTQFPHALVKPRENTTAVRSINRPTSPPEAHQRTLNNVRATLIFLADPDDHTRSITGVPLTPPAERPFIGASDPSMLLLPISQRLPQHM